MHTTSLIHWVKGNRSILPRHVSLSLMQPHNYTTQPVGFPLCPLCSQYKAGTLFGLNSAVLYLFSGAWSKYLNQLQLDYIFCGFKHSLIFFLGRNQGRYIQPVWICDSEEFLNCVKLPKWHL